MFIIVTLDYIYPSLEMMVEMADYVGPFDTHESAQTYLDTIYRDRGSFSHEIHELSTPLDVSKLTAPSGKRFVALTTPEPGETK